MYSVKDTPKGGFPHSEIFGSKVARTYPKLIAAYHVLHRLHAPRHPPYALKSLEIPPCTVIKSINHINMTMVFCVSVRQNQYTEHNCSACY